MQKETYFFHKGREALLFGAHLLLEGGARRRLWLPALYCGGTQSYLRHRGFQTSLYDVNERLLPSLEKSKISSNDIFVFCNFFGLFPDVPKELLPDLPPHVIYDSCHDPRPFFQRKTIQANLSIFSFGKSDPRNYYGAVRLENIRAMHPPTMSAHFVPFKPLIVRFLRALPYPCFDWFRKHAPARFDGSKEVCLSARLVAAVRPYRCLLPARRGMSGLGADRADLRNIQEALLPLRAKPLQPEGGLRYPHSFPFLAEDPAGFSRHALRKGLKIFRWPGRENVLTNPRLRRRHKQTWEIEKKLLCVVGNYR